MNTIELPRTIVDYFAIMNSDDKMPVVNLFAPEAVLTDDGHTYHDLDEIRSWIRGAASEYLVTSTLLSSSRTADSVVVVNRIEGNFPGGQVDLRYIFTLAESGQIKALTITV